jgi:hypothetical protein
MAMPRSSDSRYQYYQNHYKQYVGLKPFKVLPKDHKLEIPQEVLDDRDRRRDLEPQSITASQFGDPLPGYSALAKLMAKTESH